MEITKQEKYQRKQIWEDQRYIKNEAERRLGEMTPEMIINEYEKGQDLLNKKPVILHRVK